MNISASTLMNTIQNNGNKYKTGSYIKQVREADDDVEDFQDNLVEFKKIVRRIHNYNSNDTTQDKVKSYLSDLADTYNTLVSNKDKLTNSSLQKQLDKLDTLIDDNAKSLKKLGLKKSDGKLEFDEDTFDDDADKKTIKKLFEGTDSFGDQLFKITRDIDSSASDAQYVTSEKRFVQGVTYSKKELSQASSYLNIIKYSSVLNNFNEHVQNGELSDNINKYDMFYLFNKLSDSLNSTDKDGKVKALYDENKDNLNNLGFSYDENNEELIYTQDDNMDMTTEEFKQSYEALFGDSATFVSKLGDYGKEGYNQAMKLSEIKVTIDEYV
jgi:hypothetical protein